QRRGASGKPYRPTWMGKWLINTLDQEGGRKFKAPKNFQPPARPAAGALDRFLEEQRQVTSLVERSRRSDTDVTLRSPVTPLMRYSLADAFEVIVAHDRRHLRQAQRVKDSQDFPHSADRCQNIESRRGRAAGGTRRDPRLRSLTRPDPVVRRRGAARGGGRASAARRSGPASGRALLQPRALRLRRPRPFAHQPVVQFFAGRGAARPALARAGVVARG